jgi:hypothetical protein
MNIIKRISALFMALCLMAGMIVSISPERVKAAVKAFDGTIYVYNLDNDYKDGKYRIWQKIVYDLTSQFPSGQGVKLYNQYLTNSSGKTVASWKSWEILKGGGTKKIHYDVDFSKLPSDTYTLHYTVEAGNGGNYKSYTRKISHSAGQISYSSSKYEYDTNGTKSLKVTFGIKSLKGYIPKLEIFDSNGNKVCSKNYNIKVKYDETNYSFWWDFSSTSGKPLKDGTYTFKVTCNGKSCSKKLNISI